MSARHNVIAITENFKIFTIVLYNYVTYINKLLIPNKMKTMLLQHLVFIQSFLKDYKNIIY